MTVSIDPESPLNPDVALLLERHAFAMNADTPPEYNFMLDSKALAAPDISFFVLREDGVPCAMGAIRIFDGDHAEIKSMHVLSEARGRGYARQILLHLMDKAREAGCSNVSLETGTQDSFVAARALYAAAGFADCPPFGSYQESPYSQFMTSAL
ncbi:GNAT family N-acetyltransferase [Falsirhodobacter sp. alg1]|uniref:GNAT family N-acetyltransferase n=1 Tax=Falsirhodobacter sp. alg1 TaxID=1472418 RepID=UPI0006935F06|nr:GNAT family N-acetyltransferase [Falsirhodobacter sp. alg1]